MGKAFVGFQMFTGMLRPSAGGELVPHRRWCPAGPRRLISRINPEPRGFGLILPFAIALLEQLDRCVVHKDRLRLKHMVTDGVRHAFQQFGAFAYPSRHERTTQINALIGKHLALAIQRQMIAVFAAQDVGQQRGPHKTLWNGAAWHLGLDDCFAAGAGQTRAAYLVHDVMARNILQFFHHICSQHFEAATTVGASITGGDGLHNPREVFRERFALARCAGRLGLSVRGRVPIIRLSGLFEFHLFKDQLKRQLCAAF